MKYLNRYTLFARYIPGLISIFPLTLIYFFLTKKYSDFELKKYFESVTFLLGISATFILTFFISMIIREFGSFIEKKYFKNTLCFPTNYLMLYQNEEYPDQAKARYGDKINNDFGLTRLNEQEEKNDIDRAIKILNQASRLVSTKCQQNEQVKDASIAYGFSRNVSGGLLFSIPTSVAGTIIGLVLKQDSLTFWASVSSIIFIIVAIFHKKWILSNGKKYAEKLISVYLSS